MASLPTGQRNRRAQWLITAKYICYVLSGWANQLDVKIANPRNSTSPNAKAFQDRDSDSDENNNFMTLHSMDHPYNGDGEMVVSRPIHPKNTSQEDRRELQSGSRPSPLAFGMSRYGADVRSNQDCVLGGVFTNSQTLPCGPTRPETILKSQRPNN